MCFKFSILLFPNRERAKQLAEQSAAVCYLVVNGQHDGRLAEPHNETEELRQKWRGLLNSDLLKKTWSPVKDCAGTDNPGLSETESKENGNKENGDVCPQLDVEHTGKVTDAISKTIVDQR